MAKYGEGRYGIGKYGIGEETPEPVVSDEILGFPTLPPEEPFTDAEFTFRDDEPRRLFPENQDSNWGLKRKNFSDVMDDIHRKLALIYVEMFPQTSTLFLDEWERLVGLPRNPANKTVSSRRAAILARLQQGPFTRSRRNNIIDDFITATFGESIKLFPEGVTLLPAGVPIYNDVPVGQYYRVLEFVEDFSYEIQILSTITGVDEVGMRQALEFVQYAPLRFHITYVDSFSVYSYGVDRALPLTIS